MPGSASGSVNDVFKRHLTNSTAPLWFCKHNAQKLKNVHRGFRTRESRRLRPHRLGRKHVRTELVHHKKGQTDAHRLARRPPSHAENRNVRPPLLLAAVRAVTIAVAPLA